MMGRFQEFGDEWSDGVYETPLVKLEEIKQVPITMIIGEADALCTKAIADKESVRIASWTRSIYLEGKDHEYFGGANDE